MSRLGVRLIESLKEALAHAQGEPTSVTVREVSPNEIRDARLQLGMSQTEFAFHFQIPKPTLQKWEQGQRTPEGPARVLLKVIEAEPQAVLRALKVKSKKKRKPLRKVRRAAKPVRKRMLAAE